MEVEYSATLTNVVVRGYFLPPGRNGAGQLAVVVGPDVQVVSVPPGNGNKNRFTLTGNLDQVQRAVQKTQEAEYLTEAEASRYGLLVG